jgi:uncharacterized protein (DUF362 family)
VAVYIAKPMTYHVDSLAKAIETGLARLGVNLRDKRSAILKPNISFPANSDSAIITHLAVTEAMIEVLRRYEIEQIVLAEGPGGGFNVSRVFRISGYAELAERMNVSLIDLYQVERARKRWKYGAISLPKAILEADLYINLAKLKTHGQTMVTLSLKNQKGLLTAQDKKNFHRNWGLHAPIAELAKVISPHLIIVDGVVGMEGNGPSNGRKRRTGALIIGQNMLEVDLACCAIMGIDARVVPHLQYGVAEGIGPTRPTLSGAVNWNETSYALPNMDYGRVFNVFLWRNVYACSMCFDAFSTTVKGALKDPSRWFPFGAKFLYTGILQRMDLLMGRHCKPPEEHGVVICFGDCTRQVARDNGFIFVEGCPPNPAAIVRAFSEGLLSKRTKL